MIHSPRHLEQGVPGLQLAPQHPKEPPLGYPVLNSPLQRRATYFLIYDATQSNPWQRYPRALSRVQQATGSSPFLVPERPPHTAPSNQPLPQSSKVPHSPTQQLRHGKATDCQTLGPTPPLKHRARAGCGTTDGCFHNTICFSHKQPCVKPQHLSLSQVLHNPQALQVGQLVS